MPNSFITELPKINSRKNNGKIDWNKTKGMDIEIEFKNKLYNIHINDYSNRKIYFYFDKDVSNEFNMADSMFKGLNFDKCLGFYGGKHIQNVGDIIQTRTGNKIEITRIITTKKSNRKGYKYKCLKCGNIDEISESHLKEGNGCNVCSSNPLKIVEGINDIPTTVPWMVKYFQGGYSEAKMYTKGSKNKITPICPDCKRVKNKNISIYSIYNNHSIGCTCGDGLSYPEKFMFNILEQLKLEFITQANKRDGIDWCENYRYDFYLSSFNIIIEVHGVQHYKKSFDNFINSNNKVRTFKEEKENDRLKEKLASVNGIVNYIIIDSSESEFEYIKNNILMSKLNEFFDLIAIDWNSADEFATSNLCKTICEYKQRNPKESTNTIAKIMKLSNTTIRKYLKQGVKFGWCDYNVENERKIHVMRGAENKNSKKVINIETKEVFDSMKAANEKYKCNVNSYFQHNNKSAGIHPKSGEPLHWMLYKDYIVKSEEEINKNVFE